MVVASTTGDEPNQNLLKKTRIFVNHFAKDGLRTLCMAKKVRLFSWNTMLELRVGIPVTTKSIHFYQALTEEQFDAWYEKFTNCGIENHEEEERALCNELESDLDLLGATGIEDRLQDGVPESITALQAAGIKVWVLTGDKQETAVNIG